MANKDEKILPKKYEFYDFIEKLKMGLSSYEDYLMSPDSTNICENKEWHAIQRVENKTIYTINNVAIDDLCKAFDIGFNKKKEEQEEKIATGVHSYYLGCTPTNKEFLYMHIARLEHGFRAVQNCLHERNKPQAPEDDIVSLIMPMVMRNLHIICKIYKIPLPIY